MMRDMGQTDYIVVVVVIGRLMDNQIIVDLFNSLSKQFNKKMCVVVVVVVVAVVAAVMNGHI